MGLVAAIFFEVGLIGGLTPCREFLRQEIAIRYFADLNY